MTNEELQSMLNPKEKPTPPKENNRPAIIIMACAAGVYLAIMFWYIAVPVLALIGFLVYWQYRKNPKFQEKVKGKMSGLTGKFWKFMKR